jgi:hypothetical protein
MLFFEILSILMVLLHFSSILKARPLDQEFSIMTSNTSIKSNNSYIDLNDSYEIENEHNLGDADYFLNEDSIEYADEYYYYDMFNEYDHEFNLTSEPIFGH